MPDHLPNLLYISTAPLGYYVIILPMWWLAGQIAAFFAPEYTPSYVIYAMAVFLLEVMGGIYGYQYAVVNNLI